MIPNPIVSSVYFEPLWDSLGSSARLWRRNSSFHVHQRPWNLSKAPTSPYWLAAQIPHSCQPGIWTSTHMEEQARGQTCRTKSRKVTKNISKQIKLKLLCHCLQFCTFLIKGMFLPMYHIGCKGLLENFQKYISFALSTLYLKARHQMLHGKLHYIYIKWK